MSIAIVVLAIFTLAAVVGIALMPYRPTALPKKPQRFAGFTEEGSIVVPTLVGKVHLCPSHPQREDSLLLTLPKDMPFDAEVFDRLSAVLQDTAPDAGAWELYVASPEYGEDAQMALTAKGLPWLDVQAIRMVIISMMVRYRVCYGATTA